MVNISGEILKAKIHNTIWPLKVAGHKHNVCSWYKLKLQAYKLSFLEGTVVHFANLGVQTWPFHPVYSQQE